MVNTINKKKYFPLFFILFSLIFMLSACQKDLYQDLSEKQINEMLALLLKYNIHVEKSAQGKGKFTLSVDEKQLIQALEILNKNNLPRQNFQNLGEVFKGENIISSNSEENARLAFAISQELSETFSQIDGVLSARVHIVLGSIDQTTETITKPSAAVFLRHTSESPVTNFVAKIKETTAKAVPNLDFDNISIMLVPVREEISVPMQQTKSIYETLTASKLGILTNLLLLFITVVAGIYIFRIISNHYKTHQQKQQNSED